MSASASASLYDVLCVDAGATPETIKRAYRKLASKHHPDRKTGNKELMQQVQLAYDVLSDEAKRKHYDETGQTKRPVELDAAAMETLAQLFQQYIDKSAENEDPIEVVGVALRNAIADLKRNIASHPAQLEVLDRKAKACRSKRSEIDLYAGLIEQKRQALERGKQMAERRLPTFERALELLKDYESAVVPNRYTVVNDRFLHSGGYTGA